MTYQEIPKLGTLSNIFHCITMKFLCLIRKFLQVLSIPLEMCMIFWKVDDVFLLNVLSDAPLIGLLESLFFFSFFLALHHLYLT